MARHGFSLIEVLVALLVGLAVVLGFSAGTLETMRVNRVSEAQSRATSLGQAKLAELVQLTRSAGVSPSGSDDLVPPFHREWTCPNPPDEGQPAGVTVIRLTISWPGPSPGALTFRTVVNPES